MTLSDWTEQNDAANQNQSSQQAYEGTYSWYMSDNAKITLDESGVDQPSEAKIATHYYNPSDLNEKIGPMFRWQDNNNYYMAQIRQSEADIYVTKVVNGSRTKIGEPGASLSYGNWAKIEIETYVDSGGAYNLRIEVDGNYVATVQDSADDFSSGGAVGLGGAGGNEIYFDNTEVYY